MAGLLCAQVPAGEPATRAIPMAPRPVVPLQQSLPLQKMAPALPDLLISASLTPTQPTPYDAPQLSLYIINSGTADATLGVLPANAAYLSLQAWNANGTAAGGSVLDIPGLPLTIPAGKSLRVFPQGVARFTANPGSYQWTLSFDSHLTESTTTNNTVTLPVTVGARPQPGGSVADLVVPACNVQPAQPRTSDSVVISALQNTGQQTAVFAYGVQLFRADIQPALAGRSVIVYTASQDFDTVPAGGVYANPLVLVDATTTRASPGTYLVTLTADPSDRILESSKANNTRQCTLTISP